MTPKGISIVSGTEESNASLESLKLFGKIPTGITRFSEFTGDMEYGGFGKDIIPVASRGFGITQSATKFLGRTFKTGWDAPYIEGQGFQWAGGHRQDSPP